MMNYPYLNLWKLFVLALIALPSCGMANTYTAVVSGDWNSSLTWGGVIPPSQISSADNIIIGNGITVNLNVDVSINNELASINLLGTLDGNANLFVQSGSVLGTGTLIVQKLKVGANGRVITTGNILCDTLISAGNLLALSANTSVESMLKVSGGLLQVENTGTLNFASGATIEISGGSLKSTGQLQSMGMINLIYSDTCQSTGDEIHAGTIANLIVDLNGFNDTLIMNGDIVVNDTMSLQFGILSMNGYNLTLNGRSMVSDSSALSGDINSSLYVNGTDTVGVLSFGNGGGLLDSCIINVGEGGSIQLKSYLEVNSALMLMSGQIEIVDNDLKVKSSAGIIGQNLDSYIQTSGEGYLVLELTAGGGLKEFPVGSDLGFFPCLIGQDIEGSDTIELKARVMKGVFSKGTAGIDLTASASLVNHTWIVDAQDTTTKLDLDFEFFWGAQAEVNDFDRDICYISHFEDGFWDVSVASRAQTQANGQFSIKRTNITSLSPFRVVDKSTTDNVDRTLSQTRIYPNPVSSNIVIDVPQGLTNSEVRVYSLDGRYLYSKILNGYGKQSINISHLSPGQYILRIGNEFEQRILKR